MDDVLIYQPTVNRARKIGRDTRIGAFCDIGQGVIIGERCTIQCQVSIGNECTIGDNVLIGPGAHLGNDKYMNNVIEPCHIEDNVKIGMGALILPRVTVGAGAFVGAGSVVVEDVKQGATVWGNPAKEAC